MPLLFCCRCSSYCLTYSFSNSVLLEVMSSGYVLFLFSLKLGNFYFLNFFFHLLVPWVLGPDSVTYSKKLMNCMGCCWSSHGRDIVQQWEAHHYLVYWLSSCLSLFWSAQLKRWQMLVCCLLKGHSRLFTNLWQTHSSLRSRGTR